MIGGYIEELATTSDAELDDLLAAAELDRRNAEARLAAITAVIANRGSFLDHGHHSIKSYLKATLNCSGADALRLRRRASLVDRHADIGDALAGGHIATGHVDRMAKAKAHPRVGDRFDEFAPALLEHAGHLEHDPFNKLVRHFETLADPDGAFSNQQFHEAERTATVKNVDGYLELSAHGGNPLQAAEIQRIFDNAVDVEFRRDLDARRLEHGDDALAHPLPRTVQQRRFDALHQIFADSATAPADGPRPEPLVNIVIDPTTALESLARHGLIDLDNDVCESVDLASRRCATGDGTAVHPDVALRAMIHGRVRRVVVDANDVVINMGRTHRLFHGKAREAAQLLVHTCSFRGCDIPAGFCDVDHVDEWARDGGRTNQANAAPLCGKHDRHKHRAQLRGQRDVHGRIHLIRPDGTLIAPVGARAPDWPPSADDVWEEISYEKYLALQPTMPDPARLAG